MRVRTFGLAGALALMVTAPAQSQPPASQAWVHVRVEERSRQSKVSVNLPVSVVNAALQAAPEKFMSDGHIHLGRMGKNDLSVSDLRKAWNELKATGDAEFVTVEDEDETVRVSRARATSCWSTSTSPAATSPCASRCPSRSWTPSSPARARSSTSAPGFAELQKRRGDIVRVKDGDSTVRIWIDEGK